MKAWHFIRNDRKMGYGSGEVIEVGKKYSVEGEIKLCSWGLHGSLIAIDALLYAPGNIITWCEYSGEILHGDDKLVAQERTVLWMYDAEYLLKDFARWCALQVADKWNAPDIVIEYLKTGNEKIRSAAKSAAWSAADSDAWSAADSAAWSAAKSAADSAAWSAAKSAANSAADSAAWSAAKSAADYAAWSAAWSAADSAVRNKQNKKLTEMSNKLKGEI